MIKTILITLLSLVLAAAIVLTGLMFFYYPHCRQNKHVVNFGDSGDGKVYVMSCNVRCINPLDLGKKNWFYRADLLVKGIENSRPTVIGFQEVTKWQYSYLQDCLPEFLHDNLFCLQDASESQSADV